VLEKKRKFLFQGLKELQFELFNMQKEQADKKKQKRKEKKKTNSVVLKQQIEHEKYHHMLRARKSEISGDCKKSQGIHTDLKLKE
jgi:septal ring factor EnvC (AmiA/AmiB activator)